MCIATELVHSAALQLIREDGFDELLDPALVVDRLADDDPCGVARLY